MKKCSRCGETKTVDQFSKRARSKDGLNHWCKDCNKAECSRWYADNGEKARAAMADWRATNFEKKKASDSEWAKKNPEKVRAAKAKWQKANPEKCRDKLSRHRSENPDKYRVYNQNRRAMKALSGGRLSHWLSERLFKLQRGKCACCGLPLGDNYHLDHIMPLALGGANEDSNIQLLRQSCNNQKHAKHPVEFMQSRGFLL